MNRALRSLLVLLACALSVLVLAGPAGATTRGTAPSWWPLAAASEMDCYHGNPGSCAGIHHDFGTFDIIAQRWSNTQPVYAMGAGVVHVGARSAGCGHAQSRGNYVFVDHGHGVRSYYGHLGRIFVHDGQHVTPRTRLAYVGNSGYAKCRSVPWLRYLMLSVKAGQHRNHDGHWVGGRYVEIRTTSACVPGPTGRPTRVSWPQQLPRGRASHWNAVHRDVPIPAATRTCVPG